MATRVDEEYDYLFKVVLIGVRTRGSEATERNEHRAKRELSEAKPKSKMSLSS